MSRSIVVKRPDVAIRDVYFFSKSSSQLFQCLELRLNILTINGIEGPYAYPLIIIILITTTTDDSDN